MNERISLMSLQKLKGYKEILSTTLFQQLRQLRQNKQIPRKLKITKTDSRKNIQFE